MDALFNTRSFKLELSTNGETWHTVSKYRHNTDNVTDTDIAPTKARYVRLSILDAGKDGIARIGDVEVYGKCITPLQ